MREREEQHRNTTDSIQGRIVVYSIITLALLLILSIVQSVYAKRFFQSKKLI